MLRPTMMALTPANARRLVALSHCEALQVKVTDEIANLAKTDLVNPEDFAPSLRATPTISVIQKLVDANMRAVILVEDCNDAATHFAIKIAIAVAFHQRAERLTFYARSIYDAEFWRKLVADLGDHKEAEFNIIRRTNDVFETSPLYDLSDDARSSILITDTPHNALQRDHASMDFPKSVVIAPHSQALDAIKNLHSSLPDAVETNVYQFHKTRQRFFGDRNVWAAMNVIDDLLVSSLPPRV